MNKAQQDAIQSGVDVTLSNGSVEHFSLTDHDQTSLVGLQTQVTSGEENIPWHTSDETKHCKFYSNADMAKITATAMAFSIYWGRYACHLLQYGFSYQLSQLCLMIIFDTSCGARRFHIINCFRLEVD